VDSVSPVSSKLFLFALALIPPFAGTIFHRWLSWPDTYRNTLTSDKSKNGTRRVESNINSNDRRENLALIPPRAGANTWWLPIRDFPIESGNGLHRFMNGVLWAVLTSRIKPSCGSMHQDYNVCEVYDEGSCWCQWVQPKPDRRPVGLNCEGLCSIPVPFQPSLWIPSFRTNSGETNSDSKPIAAIWWNAEVSLTHSPVLYCTVL
jgi:hypothetical protein